MLWIQQTLCQCISPYMKPEMFMMNKLFPLPKQGKIWHTLMQCDARKSVLEFGLRLNARIFLWHVSWCHCPEKQMEQEHLNVKFQE